MSITIPNKSPNNFNFRIAKKSNNIVCDNGGYWASQGCRGAHIKVLAKPHPEIGGEFIANSFANLKTVEKAANVLDVKIHTFTKKHGSRVFERGGELCYL